MNNQLKQIGELIAQLRIERGVTQAELAEGIKTKQSVIARIEKGEQNVSTETLTKISNALNQDIVRVSNKSLNLKIKGGQKLSGSIKVKTSKNAAVALLCASLLNKGTTTLKRMPKIEEVHRLIEVLRSIGVSVKWTNGDVVIKPPKELKLNSINEESARKTRSVILFIGPLLHHIKKFNIPQAGGCKLGSRTVKPHFFALEDLGVDIKATKDHYSVSHKGLKANEIILYESGDTVTENALMAASLIPGETTIKYASANYMVQDLCNFLTECGVEIKGIGTTTLTIKGVPEIKKDITYSISEDPIEAMFLLASAIVTKSNITIEGAPLDFLELELLKLRKMGFKYSIKKERKGSNNQVRLGDITTKPSKLVALEEKIDARPYPGINIDNLPFFAVIATQTEGTTFIHDWVYEKRAIHYKELDKLGADTLLADPHRIYITGPTKLKPAEIICPPALRPAAIVLIGMLGADGTSVLRNIYNINRGYEDLVKRLNGIGAQIKILNEF